MSVGVAPRSSSTELKSTLYSKNAGAFTKILSARGIASRRKAEEYIAAGLVKVNGKVMKVGDKADPDKDTIEVDGKVLQARQEMLYYVVYKPVGVVTENISREDGSQSVRDLLPKIFREKSIPSVASIKIPKVSCFSQTMVSLRTV